MSTALYRRYRPDTFAEVIGQSHVTQPLSVALDNDRVNHAYLFSGPRGCGKTTSARILARCLNCEQGPTSTPCGVCPSCVELARGGTGSLDVVEIDAASHGGVDDARDLRERAVFAPVRDRYKVFIIDEAHMVSTQGFNALLKIVEEPPEHIRFIFATTEPEKVIGTIRSRTHHYPFRLVPPETLTGYLAEMCSREGVPVGKGVLPLVVRAGAGSVRDSLSVLDQLIAGAGPDGLLYPTAVALLGYTDAALLDEVVDALAAVDGSAVFTVIDRVIQSGHDPRRFVEDLLERLRDLLVVAALGDRGHAVFAQVPDDQLDRMRGQASRFGAAELSRAADVTNAALTEMTGATSPRLQLELLCARLLLPAADGAAGLGARMDRLEKRVGVSGGPPSAGPPEPSEVAARAAAMRSRVPVGPAAPPEGPEVMAEPEAPAGTERPVTGQALHPTGDTSSKVRRGRGTDSEGGSGGSKRAGEDPAPAGQDSPELGPEGQVSQGQGSAGHGLAGQGWTGEGPAGQGSVGRGPAGRGPVRQVPAELAQDSARQSAAGPGMAGHAQAGQTAAGGHSAAAGRSAQADMPGPGGATAQPAVSAPGAELEAVRRVWADVLNTLSGLKRASWSLVSQHAQVLDYDGDRLLLGFGSVSLANSFNRGAHQEFLRQALIEVIGLDCRIEARAGMDQPPAASVPARTEAADGGSPSVGARAAQSGTLGAASMNPTVARRTEPARELPSGSPPGTPRASAASGSTSAAPGGSMPDRASLATARSHESGVSTTNAGRRPQPPVRAGRGPLADPYRDVPPSLDEPPSEDEVPPEDAWTGRGTQSGSRSGSTGGSTTNGGHASGGALAAPAPAHGPGDQSGDPGGPPAQRDATGPAARPQESAASKAGALPGWADSGSGAAGSGLTGSGTTGSGVAGSGVAGSGVAGSAQSDSATSGGAVSAPSGAARSGAARSAVTGSALSSSATRNSARSGAAGSGTNRRGSTGSVPSVSADPPAVVIDLASDVPSVDDPDIEGSQLVGARLVEQMLGGRVIEERTE